MNKKIKMTIVRLVVIALLVCLIFALTRPIIHAPFGTVWISVQTADGIFRVRLTDEEARTVRRMLNGKIFDKDLYFTGAACGFGPKRAIEIGNTLYYVSQDDCGAVQIADTNYYYCLSPRQWDTLWTILKAYGAVHI